MTWTTTMKWSLATLVVGMLAGMGLEWRILKPKPAKAEVAAPAVVQPDGSRILERAASTPATEVKVPHQLPPGAVLEREEQGVTIQPYASAVALPPMPGFALPAAPQHPTVLSQTPGTPCPPVHFDLSLVRMPDQSHRVIVSSPDGTVTGGLDIPVEPPIQQPKVCKYSAGLVYGVAEGGRIEKGLYLDHDLAFARVGLECTRTTSTTASGWGVRLKAGINF